MKKCTSCSKDLPDAALHCVFCGAKQAAAPQQPGVAKTVMGYSAQEMIEQIRQQQAAGAGAGPRPQAPAPAPAPMAPAPMAPAPPVAPNMAPTMMVQAPPSAAPKPGQPMGNYLPTMAAAPMPQPPPSAPAAPAPHAPPAPAPISAPVFGPGGGGPSPGPGPSIGGFVPTPGPAMGPGPSTGGPAGAPVLNAPPPIAARPAPAPMPMTAGGVGVGASADPLHGTLKLAMLVFGILLIAAFAVPMSTDPMRFHWDGLGDMKVTELAGTLLIGGLGVIALLLALIPMGTAPRGLIVGIVALAGMLLPLTIVLDIPDLPVLVLVQFFLGILSVVLILSGLIARAGYPDAILGRLLATIGVVLAIALVLIPDDHGRFGEGIPLVQMFKAVIDAPNTKALISSIFEVLYFVLAVAALLVWLPGPGSGGTKIIAWAFVLLPAIQHFIGLALGDNIGDLLSKTPNEALLAWVPEVGFMALAGFGLGAALGKMTE